MDPPLAATAAFVLATTFSPGPNNILSGSIAMLRGYRGALPFMVGVFTGFAITMLVCAAAAAVLLDAVPGVEPILKYVGAAYILWTIQRVFLGPLNKKYEDFEDMDARETFCQVPFAALAVLFGVAPFLLLDVFNRSVEVLIDMFPKVQ